MTWRSCFNMTETRSNGDAAFTMNDVFGDARHDPVFALHSTRERRDGEPAHCRPEAGHAAVGRSHWPRRNLRLLEITERGPGMGAENDNARNALVALARDTADAW